MLAQDPTPFAEYLAAHGAEILATTNPYEILRYRMDDCGLVIIHKNGKGALSSMPAVAWSHYQDFKKNRAPSRTKRPSGASLESIRRRLIDRDGDRCCYCSCPLNNDMTLEHWLPVRDGGNNCFANIALAHSACNRAADSLPIMQKIILRDVLTSTARNIGARLDDDTTLAIATSVKEGLAQC